MWGWNHQMWRKKKGTTKCDKRIVTCNVGPAQYKDETIKYEDLITWYSRLPTSRYHTPKKRRYGRINPANFLFLTYVVKKAFDEYIKVLHLGALELILFIKELLSPIN